MQDVAPDGMVRPENDEHIAYTHRPKPLSAVLELVLANGFLRAERGRWSQKVSVNTIEKITLAYTPKNAAQNAFTCWIDSKGAQQIKFHNVSWKSLVEAERLDADYSRFVRVLVARAAQANPNVLLEAGVSRWRYSLSMIVGIGILMALVMAAIYAMLRQSTIIGLLSLGLAAYLGFWLKRFLTRNKPSRFTPASVPPDVLPL